MYLGGSGERGAVKVGEWGVSGELALSPSLDRGPGGDGVTMAWPDA